MFAFPQMNQRHSRSVFTLYSDVKWSLFMTEHRTECTGQNGNLFNF